MVKGLHSRSKYNETLTRRDSTWVHHQKAVTQRFFLWMMNDVNSGEKQEKKNIPYAISNLDIGFQTVSAEIMASGSNEVIYIGV